MFGSASSAGCVLASVSVSAIGAPYPEDPLPPAGRGARRSLGDEARYRVAVSTHNRLYRSRSRRLLAGVCGGLAEFFGLNPTLVRIGFVFFGLFGIGEVVYLVLWLIVPKEPR